MTWTTPRDWIPAVLSSSDLDSQLSGNMNHLSTHTHDGTPGNGSQVILDNLKGTAHRLYYTDATGLLIPLAFGTSGQILRFNGLTSPPTVGNLDGVAATANRLFYADNAGTLTPLAFGAAGAVLKSTGLTSAPVMSTLLGYSLVDYTWMPDVGAGEPLFAGDQQGFILHAGPADETAITLIIDAETPPSAGVTFTLQFGNTNDLDTVASWTTIVSMTLAAGAKTQSTTTMTNATITGDRLLRMNVGAVPATPPRDVTITLRVKRPLTV